MSGVDALALRGVIAAALALVLCGVFVGWTAGNAAKRTAAHALAVLGAVMAGAAIGAPIELLVAAVAIGLGYLLVGAALVVRLQEEYASVEVADIDKADASDDAPRPKA